MIPQDKECIVVASRVFCETREVSAAHSAAEITLLFGALIFLSLWVCAAFGAIPVPDKAVWFAKWSGIVAVVWILIWATVTVSQ